jgi:hypothetical protein
MRKRYDRVELFVSGCDDALLCGFDYYSGCAPTMYRRNGDPGDPGDSPEVELLYARLGNIDMLDAMTSDERDELEAAAFEYATEDETCEDNSVFDIASRYGMEVE